MSSVESITTVLIAVDRLLTFIEAHNVGVNQFLALREQAKEQGFDDIPQDWLDELSRDAHQAIDSIGRG